MSVKRRTKLSIGAIGGDMKYESSEIREEKISESSAFFHSLLQFYYEGVMKNTFPNTCNSGISYSSEKKKRIFDKWCRDLDKNFSVFVFGMGSKSCELDDFGDYLIDRSPHHVLKLNGAFYHDGGCMEVVEALKAIYNVPEFSKKGSRNHKSVFLKDFFINLQNKINSDSFNPKTVVIFDNVDHVTNETAPEGVFCGLLEGLSKVSPHIKLLVSYSDPFFVSTVPFSEFISSSSIVHYHWSTLRSYRHEISANNYLDKIFDMEVALGSETDPECLTERGAFTFDAVSCVYKSLTPNAQQIFDFIVLCALETTKKNNPGKISVSHDVLYEHCRRNFLTTNENSLQSQMVEFIDHGFIEKVDHEEGLDCRYDVKISRNILQRLLADTS